MGVRCIEYLLLLFNFIFLTFGIGIIVGGFLSLYIYQDYEDFTGNTGKAVLIVLICVGFFTMPTAVCGWCGVLKWKQGPLKVYFFFMVLIIIMELGAGISGYLLCNDSDKWIDENMRYLQREYNSSTLTRNLFDIMQQDLKCCGVHNYTDWMGWVADQPEILPDSCCKVVDTPGCFIVGSATFDIYTDPCYPALRGVLLGNIGIIAGVTIGIAVIEDWSPTKTSKMAGGGLQRIKLLLFFFNLIFSIFGIGIIVGGFLSLNQDYGDFTSDTGRAILIVLIYVGFFIIITAFFGCYGALMHSEGTLKVYFFFMVLIIILELGAGICGYVLRDDIDKMIDENMRYRQRTYHPTPTKHAFDIMQQDLKCCGVHNYTDWMGWIADQPKILPNSCCKVPDTPGCFIVGSATFDIYTDPCYPALKDLVLSNIRIIAGVAIGMAVIEIFVLVLVGCFMRMIRIRGRKGVRH